MESREHQKPSDQWAKTAGARSMTKCRRGRQTSVEATVKPWLQGVCQGTSRGRGSSNRYQAGWPEQRPNRSSPGHQGRWTQGRSHTDHWDVTTLTALKTPRGQEWLGTQRTPIHQILVSPPWICPIHFCSDVEEPSLSNSAPAGTMQVPTELLPGAELNYGSVRAALLTARPRTTSLSVLHVPHTPVLLEQCQHHGGKNS